MENQPVTIERTNETRSLFDETETQPEFELELKIRIENLYLDSVNQNTDGLIKSIRNFCDWWIVTERELCDSESIPPITCCK